MKISKSQLRRMIREVMADLEEDAIFSRPDILGLQPEKDIHGDKKSPCDIENSQGRNLSYGSGPSPDNESRMTKSQLFKVARYAQSLHDMLQDSDDLPEWVQSKIAVMDNDIGKIKHYLEYKLNRMKG